MRATPFPPTFSRVKTRAKGLTIRAVTTLFCLLLAAIAPATAPDTSALIQALTASDPAIRRNAAADLARLGPAARPALVDAARGDSPELRSRAAELLLKLPFDRPGDAPEVRKLLKDYGTKPAPERRRIVITFADRHPDVLLRLLGDEPYDSVRWTIAGALLEPADEVLIAKLRQLHTTRDDAPVLCVAGRAWFNLDREKGAALLRRAIDAEARDPSPESRPLDAVFSVLVADAVAAGRLDEAAALLRRQIPRQAGQTRSALARLMALHGYLGPLKGLDDDLKRWGKPSAAATQPQMAALAQIDDLQEHQDAGAFLYEIRRFDDAEKQFLAALTPDADGQTDVRIRDMRNANTQYMLSRVYVARGDDSAAAGALEKMLALKARSDLVFTGRGEGVVAEMHWRKARAARQRGDAKAMAENVSALLRHPPPDPDQAIEMVNWLDDSGLKDDAARLFEPVYQQAKALLDASPNNPGRMNDVAWLCARTRRRLPEAVQLADRAIELMPESAAFLDTAAEAHFASGNAARAIELESKALQIRPNDAFMRSQLARFRGAATRP